LMEQGCLGNETKELFERSLSNFIRNGGPDGVNGAHGNLAMGQFYSELANIQDMDNGLLLLAKSYFIEAVRIRTKAFGPTHPETLAALSHLATVSNAPSSLSNVSLDEIN
jgi:hypothetical protein